MKKDKKELKNKKLLYYFTRLTNMKSLKKREPKNNQKKSIFLSKKYQSLVVLQIWLSKH